MEDRPLAPGNSPQVTSRSEEARNLEEFLSDLIGSSPFDVHCRVSDEEDRIRVEVDGTDRDFFLERRGEGLLALQVLLGRIASQRSYSKPVFVDSAGFRHGLEEEISEIAVLAAEKVKKLGEPHKLRPMDPYERRLVHLALKDDSGVETESEGDGFQKRVVIRPRPTTS